MEYFTCLNKYHIHYIWLLVIYLFDLTSVICSFVYYNVSDKPPSALTSAILISIAFGCHCFIGCYFYWLSEEKMPKCECNETSAPYYGGAIVLVVTLGLQLAAAILIANAALESANGNENFAGATSTIDFFGALVSFFFICFVYAPIICCRACT